MTADLDAFARFAEELADTANAMLRAGVGAASSATLKPDKSFVTDLDGQIERRLRAMIAARHPAHGILGEEEGGTPDAEWVWVLDPIDGTAPFIAGVPVYGSLIALAHRATPVIGIIDLPVTGDRWVGVKGRATRHGVANCATRRSPDLAGAILTASNPDFFDDAERPALDALRAKTAWRIYGGCCMAYGLLASGRTDIAIDTRMKVWDYAPYPPIIEGAGGVITDWRGQPLTIHGGPQILAAGDRARHAEALAIVRRAVAP